MSHLFPLLLSFPAHAHAPRPRSRALQPPAVVSVRAFDPKFTLLLQVSGFRPVPPQKPNTPYPITNRILAQWLALRSAPQQVKGSNPSLGKMPPFSFFYRTDSWTPPVSDPLRHLSLQPAQSAPRVTGTHLSSTLGWVHAVQISKIIFFPFAIGSL